MAIGDNWYGINDQENMKDEQVDLELVSSLAMTKEYSPHTVLAFEIHIYVEIHLHLLS
jgi:proline dehydrogenase